MILIIGGACQGKTALARELSGMGEEQFACCQADGVTDGVTAALGKRFLTGFHGWIRQILEAGEDPEEFVRQILREDPELVTMDEVGCGIVPVERLERDYREAVGRAGQLLAQNASQVFRVICGIPVRIKG
ncbi:MAG: hypothetical protein HFG54_13975 [Lachnospiraceae bacterium]|jgi:adenosylcobinamide kinase/adenosylcobinamide-phosphate guanylyltransferase|nr:hypothetical protein [Lachnospiraceae bacterium]